MATATAKATPPTPEKMTRPIAEERLVIAEEARGSLLHVTLPDDMRIEEGEQNIELWSLLARKLHVGQWLEVQNDSGSMYRLMRVAELYGSAGASLRGLVLVDVAPPRFSDKAIEPIAKTGEWYVRWGGPFRKWMVITPGGAVFRDGVGSEAEARNACHNSSRNPKR